MLKLRIKSEIQTMQEVVKMKSIYAEKSEDDGQRILITRYYPRGVKKTHFDDWVRELAPSRELLKQYKEGEITWDKFEKKFMIEMNDHESIEKLQSLSTQAKNKPITLLCYEKNDHDCHRHLVQDLMLSLM